jgi:hypothetical protein
LRLHGDARTRAGVQPVGGRLQPVEVGRRLQARLLVEVLAVDQRERVVVERHAVGLAVDLCDVPERLAEVLEVEALNRGDAIVERLEEAPGGEVEHPRVVDDEHVVAGLRRQERAHDSIPHLVVGQCLDVDLHVRVPPLEVGEHRVDDVGIRNLLHDHPHRARDLAGLGCLFLPVVAAAAHEREPEDGGNQECQYALHRSS